MIDLIEQTLPDGDDESLDVAVVAVEEAEVARLERQVAGEAVEHAVVRRQQAAVPGHGELCHLRLL